MQYTLLLHVQLLRMTVLGSSRNAPSNISIQFPYPEGNPRRFTELVLSTCWIGDSLVQSFCIEFLSN